MVIAAPGVDSPVDDVADLTETPHKFGAFHIRFRAVKLGVAPDELLDVNDVVQAESVGEVLPENGPVTFRFPHRRGVRRRRGRFFFMRLREKAPFRFPHGCGYRRRRGRGGFFFARPRELFSAELLENSAVAFLLRGRGFRCRNWRGRCFFTGLRELCFAELREFSQRGGILFPFLRIPGERGIDPYPRGERPQSVRVGYLEDVRFQQSVTVGEVAALLQGTAVGVGRGEVDSLRFHPVLKGDSVPGDDIR